MFPYRMPLHFFQPQKPDGLPVVFTSYSKSLTTPGLVFAYVIWATASRLRSRNSPLLEYSVLFWDVHVVILLLSRDFRHRSSARGVSPPALNYICFLAPLTTLGPTVLRPPGLPSLLQPRGSSSVRKTWTRFLSYWKDCKAVLSDSILKCVRLCWNESIHRSISGFSICGEQNCTYVSGLKGSNHSHIGQICDGRDPIGKIL